MQNKAATGGERLLRPRQNCAGTSELPPRSARRRHSRTSVVRCQLNSGNRHGRALEDLEAEHGRNARLYAPMIVLDHVVEVY